MCTWEEISTNLIFLVQGKHLFDSVHIASVRVHIDGAFNDAHIWTLAQLSFSSSCNMHIEDGTSC